jgi:16S rRNA (cytosine967-C5)-methyltransferase
LLAPGGRLVYATCSVLRAENEAVLAAFRAESAEAQSVPVPAAFGRVAGDGRQNLPGMGGMDGFYYAIVEKPR